TAFLQRLRVNRTERVELSGWSRYLPGIVVGAAGALLLILALPSATPKDGMNVTDFAMLPVMDGGRIKPIDTVARVNLMLISGRQSFKDESDATQPAIRWLLDVMVSNANDDARKHKVFRIENDQVLDLLELPRRPGSYRYSIDEIAK